MATDGNRPQAAAFRSEEHQTSEESDVNVRFIVGGIGAVAAGIALSLLLVQIYTAGMPTRPEDGIQPPPKPQLQPQPRTELQQLRTAKLNRLGGYGWVDPSRGIVHIPIERAMALIASGDGEPAP